MFVKLGGLKLYLERTGTGTLLGNRNESHGWARISISYLYSLSPDPDPGFSENPVPDLIQAFWWVLIPYPDLDPNFDDKRFQKICWKKSNFVYNKNAVHVFIRSHNTKDFQLQKKPPVIQNMKFPHFFVGLLFILWVLPRSGSWSNVADRYPKN